MTSKQQFARGTVRARVATGNGNIRIEGSVTASKRVKGLAMHPNTARALGEWLLSVTTPVETTEPRAYFETHEPPHCPSCDCGVPKVKSDLHADIASNTSWPCTAENASERRCLLHPEMPCPAKTDDDTCRCTPPQNEKGGR